MKRAYFMDIIDIPRLVSMKRGNFMDIIDIWGLVSMKMAFFMDKNKKETPRKDASAICTL
jgi:hypothetical protein